MSSFSKVLISVALLSSVVLGSPADQESVVGDLTLSQPMSEFGIPLNDDNDRIYGGREASVGQFPYQATLQYGPDHRCGASIISDRFVLTAAHCMVHTNPSFYDLKVGGHGKHQNDGVIYELKQWIVHERFNITETHTTISFGNDIALIETVARIVFNEKVSSIAVQGNFIAGSVHALASGWGRSNVSGTLQLCIDLEVIVLIWF